MAIESSSLHYNVTIFVAHNVIQIWGEIVDDGNDFMKEKDSTFLHMESKIKKSLEK